MSKMLVSLSREQTSISTDFGKHNLAVLKDKHDQFNQEQHQTKLIANYVKQSPVKPMESSINNQFN